MIRWEECRKRGSRTKLVYIVLLGALILRSIYYGWSLWHRLYRGESVIYDATSLYIYDGIYITLRAFASAYCFCRMLYLAYSFTIIRSIDGQPKSNLSFQWQSFLIESSASNLTTQLKEHQDVFFTEHPPPSINLSNYMMQSASTSLNKQNAAISCDQKPAFSFPSGCRRSDCKLLFPTNKQTTL